MTVYRNPRFMFDHIYAYGPAALIEGDEDPNFPLRNLIDLQNGPQWNGLDDSLKEQVVFSTLFTSFYAIRPYVERVIIANQTEAIANSQRVSLFGGAANPPAAQMTFLDTVPADLYAQPDFTDFEVTPMNAQRMMAEFAARVVSSVPHQAGEVFASSIHTTSSGIVQSWEDIDQPNVRTATTESGNVYSQVRGSARRIWNLEYQNLDEEDTETLDLLRRTAGIQSFAFWFDPPDSGDVEVPGADFEDTGAYGQWNEQGGGTLTFKSDADGNPASTPYLEYTSAGTNVHYATFEFDEQFSMIGRMLQFDVFVPAGATWAGSANESLLVGLTMGGTVGALPDVFYQVPVFVQQAADDTWRRYTIDLVESKLALQGTSAGSVDFERIKSIAWGMQNQAASDFVRIANAKIIDKRKRAQYVELMSYEKQQASNNPGARVRYDVSITLRQVLS